MLNFIKSTNIKISHKIAASFLILNILLLIVCGNGIMATNQLKDHIDTLSTQCISKLEKLTNVQQITWHIRADMIEAMVQRDKTKREALVNDVTEDQKSLQEFSTDYRKYPLIDEEKIQLETLGQYLDKWLNTLKNIKDPILNFLSSDFILDQVTTYWLPQTDSLIGAFSQLANTTQQQAATFQKSSADASRLFWIVAIISMFLTLATSRGIGVLLYFLISRPMKTLREVTMEATTKLPQGNFNISLESLLPYSGKNEVGEVVLGFQTMIITLQQLFNNVSIMENEYTHLEQASMQDPLTKAQNRQTWRSKAMQAFIDLQVNGLSDSATSLNVIFMDIDHFKLINDTYGHDAGDQALIHLVKCINKCLREPFPFPSNPNIEIRIRQFQPRFVLGRYGGEEFVLLLPGMNHDDSLSFAEHLRQVIAQSPVYYRDQTITLTISFGVASAPEHAMTVDELTKKADLALYIAKQQGRNRVISAVQINQAA
jgi:GGDEF domain-containing protein